MSEVQTATMSVPPEARITATSVPSSAELPSKDAVAKSASLEVLDSEGRGHTFESLAPKDGTRVLIIFIRHFYCGMCEDFLVNLCGNVTPDILSTAPKPTSIKIIGCGDYTLIKEYTERLQCPFPVYADTSRKLYDAFGMISTLSMGDSSPDYQPTGALNSVFKSLAHAVTDGPIKFFTKAGPLRQVGGDFVFENGEPVWCHRMQNTRDHTSVADLKAVLQI